jgi:hypothetical protein
LQKIFRKQRKYRISASSQEEPHVKATIATITRAYKNRARFAIKQKKLLKKHVNKLQPPAFKQRVIHEVNADLKSVIDVLVHFENFDEGLKRLSLRACRWVRDDIPTRGTQ